MSMESGVDAEVLAQLLAFVEQTTDIVAVSDPWGRILYLNPAARKRLGVADTPGVTLADLMPAEAFAHYYEIVRPQLLRTGSWSGEIVVNVGGTGAVPMYVSATATLGPGGETNGGVVYAHEIPRVDSVASRSEVDVDETTGLLAPSAFEEQVDLALAHAHRDGETCALVLADIADIDGLIEDWGVEIVASVMRTLASRLTGLARTIDIVGRVGEFQLALLLRGIRSHGEALRIRRTVNEHLADPPVTTPGGEVAVHVGCGIALAQADDRPADLMRRAVSTISRDVATQDKAADATNVTPDRTDAAVGMNDFYIAMSHGDVRPYAQPVVDLGSGRLIGYQGLARWHHRRLGTLGADAFFDMIAETPLANEVELYVVREIAAALVLTTRDTPLRLYAPASRRLIADVRTEQYLSEIADAFFLRMRQIRLQVARPLVTNLSPALQDALQSLGDADVGLVLTDVEQASDVQSFATYGLCELHISRRLTAAALTDRNARTAIAEIARVAHARRLLVAATGVEHEQHQDLLIQAGCDLAIGSLYGDPKPANTIE
jgi:diguanylate cyclase (GGDEF)-like protein